MNSRLLLIVGLCIVGVLLLMLAAGAMATWRPGDVFEVFWVKFQ